MNRRRTGIFRKTSVHIIYLNRQFRDKITIDQHRSKDLLFAVIVDKRVSVQLITNRFRIRLRNGDRQGVISCMFSVKPLLKNGDEMILSEFSNDTVFSYGKEGTKPLLVRTPAPRSTFPLKLMSVSACSRRFLFLDVIEKVYRRNIKKLDGDSFVYDYREKEIFTPVLVNRSSFLDRIIYIFPSVVKNQ